MPDHTGRALIAAGWSQGSLIAAVPLEMGVWERRPGGSAPEWIRRAERLRPGDMLVVTSQVCDIIKDPSKEPYVEAIRAFWTREPSIIFYASRNSARYFLLRRGRPEEPGDGLIADSGFRVQIDKQTLLGLSPLRAFDASVEDTPRQYAQWLGARYNRPAIPDDLVKWIQKPIAEGVEKAVRKGDPDRMRQLNGVHKILFRVHNDTPPFRVEMCFIQGEDESAKLGAEDQARLVGWMAELVAEAGGAKLESSAFFDLAEISVRDYLDFVELSLDHFTLERA